jgi:hypothetical protein
MVRAPEPRMVPSWILCVTPLACVKSGGDLHAATATTTGFLCLLGFPHSLRALGFT